MSRVLTRAEGLERKEWLRWRRKGIGSSDAPAILGLSNYASPLSVWFEKVEGVEDDDAGERALWGRLLEPVIAQEFGDRTGLGVVKALDMLMHDEHDWMIADPDFFVLDHDTEDPVAVVEVKTGGEWTADEWDDDEAPVRYQVQVQHQLAVTGLRKGYLVVLLGGNRLEVRELERDDLLIDNLIEAERKFWSLVEAGTPPALDGSDVTTDLLKRRFRVGEPDEVAVLTDETAALVEQRGMFAEREKAAAEEKKRLDNEIRLVLGPAEVGLWGDEQLVTWRTYMRRQFKSKALREAHPALAEEFTTTEPQRRLHYPKGD